MAARVVEGISVEIWAEILKKDSDGILYTRTDFELSTISGGKGLPHLAQFAFLPRLTVLKLRNSSIISSGTNFSAESRKKPSSEKTSGPKSLI